MMTHEIEDLGGKPQEAIPLFELHGPNGEEWKLYKNGTCTGFPNGTVVLNRAVTHLYELNSLEQPTENTMDLRKEMFEVGPGAESIGLVFTPEAARETIGHLEHGTGQKETFYMYLGGVRAPLKSAETND